MSRGVWLAALLAVLGRFPSALWPLRPDEAGFLLVARAWAPTPDSVYGPYFVDRAPEIIGLMRLTDWLGGAYFHRVVGTLGCGLLVLAVAAAAKEVVRAAGSEDPDLMRRVSTWTAACAAAFVVSPQIDAAAVKGEVLGIPLIAGACWLVLRAVRLDSWRCALIGGFLAALAVGMKQNLVGGLAFGAVVLVGSALARRISWAATARLSAAAAVGVAIPVLGTALWALWAGVRLDALWYAVVGFRGDANDVIAAQQSGGAAADRFIMLGWVFLGTGMALLAAWFVLRLPRLWRRLPVVTVAVVAMLALDTLGVVLGGSFWRPYLFVLIPDLALAGACLLTLSLEHERRTPRRVQALVGVIVASSVISLGSWLTDWWIGDPPREYVTGRAIGAASRVGDTLVVYGGRADLQWASGLRSTYPYLWSLPMRTLDPGLADLGALLTGPYAPTWVVEAVRLDAWSEFGTEPIERSLLSNYELVQTACDEYRVYHLNTVDPVRLDLDCETPWPRHPAR